MRSSTSAQIRPEQDVRTAHIPIRIRPDRRGCLAATGPSPAAPRGAKTFGPAATAGTSRIVLIDRPQSPQSLIYGGVVLPLSGTDDLLALNTANSILGTDFLSRINADLRETKGWSYGVRGTINQMQHQAPYLISAPVQANRTGESITALMQQYDGFLTTNGVTPPELKRTIDGNTRSLARAGD